MACVNRNHPDFATLLDSSGLHPLVLEAEISLWMEKNNNLEEFPTLSQLGLGKDLMYQIPRGNVYIQQAKKIFFDEIYQKDLSEFDVQRLTEKVREISERIGDVPYSVRLSNKGTYYIAGYKNRPVTADNYYSPYAQGIFRQLRSQSQEARIEKLDKKLTSWARRHGISVQAIKEVIKRYPERYEKSAIGVADFSKGLIAIADDSKVDTLAEEVAHFAIEMLAKDPEMQKALEQVVGTTIYGEVKEDYKNIYNTEEDFRKEALGKILASELVNQFKVSESLERQSGFWQRLKNIGTQFVNWVKRNFGKGTAARTDLDNVIIPLAESILKDESLGVYGDIETIKNQERIDSDIKYQIEQAEEKHPEGDPIKESSIKSKEKFLDEVILQLESRLEAFSRAARKPEQIAALKKNITELQEKKANAEYDLGIAKFTQQAEAEVNTVLDAMKNYKDKPMSATNLVLAADFLDMYTRLFNQVTEDLLDNDIPKEEREKIFETTEHVRALIGQGNIINKALLKNISIEVLKKANINYNGEVIDANFNPEEIGEETFEDANIWRLQAGNYKYADSGIIRAAHKIIFNSIQNVNRFTVKEGNDILAAQELFLKKYKIEDVVEKDSKKNLTHYLVREHNYNLYYEELNKTRDKIAKELGFLDPDTKKPDYFLINTSLLNEQDLKKYKSMWSDFFEENQKSTVVTNEQGEKERVNTLADKYLNKDFAKKMQDPVFKNYYEALVTSKKQAVDKLPINYRTDRLVYMIPPMLKSTLDRLTADKQGSIFARIGKLGREALFLEEDETQFGQFNKLGKKVIPIFFTSTLKDTKDLSYDLGRSFTIFAEMAENFQEMNKISGELGAIQKTLAERNYWKDKQRKPGTTSRDYQALEEMVQTNVYGREREEGKKIVVPENGFTKAIGLAGKTFSTTKLSQATSTFIRDNNLAFNLTTSLAGYLKGTGDSIIEDSVGLYTTTESKNWSRGEYMQNMPHVISELGKPKQTNKMHLILQKNGIVKMDTMLKDSTRNRAARKVLNKDIMYSTFATGDYGIKGRITLAVYDNHRLYNGQFLDRETFYKVTASQKNVANDSKHQKSVSKEWAKLREKSLYNAYEVIDGQLQVKKEFKKVVTKELLNSVNGKIEHVATNVDGVMSHTDKGKLARSWAGDFLLMHRGWFVNLIDTRFMKEKVNWLTEKEEIGYYRASTGFLYNSLKEIFTEGNFPMTGSFQSWNNLSDARKRGVVKTALDFLFLSIAAFLAALAQRAADDDEDDFTIQYSAYLLNRLLLEQGAAWSPGELVEIIDEPVVGARFFKEVVAIGDAVSGEEYQRGMYKGKSKAQKYWMRKLPTRNLYELQYPEEKNKFIKTLVGYGIFNQLADKEANSILNWNSVADWILPYKGSSWKSYSEDDKNANIVSSIEYMENDNGDFNEFN